MVKYLLMGVAVSGATLLPGGMALWLARAQMQPTVPVQCPQNPVWMQGFSFQELVSLSPQQYRLAQVNGDGVRVRDRAGFESTVVFTLSRNDRVTIIGEAWDAECNQWMRVSTNRGDYWMHGDTLAYPEDGIGPIDDPMNQPTVVSVCPEALWMESFRLFELSALAPAQYRLARVSVRNGANVREGVGFDARVAFALPINESVTITGEAWDGACNQWMQVSTNQGTYWMHGDTLMDDAITQGPPAAMNSVPVGSGLPSWVMDQCPEATWTGGYRVDELIPLAEEQYRAAVVHKNGTRLRNKAGFESETIDILNAGDPLLVVGEAWDGGCNQWMQVQIDGQRLWVHGDLVRN